MKPKICLNTAHTHTHTYTHTHTHTHLRPKHRKRDASVLKTIDLGK
jgi:hypothetical protein